VEFDLSDKEVDEMMKRIGMYETLILDLRSNPGGLDKNLRRLLGYFFDHDIKIGDEKQRNKVTPSIAKSQGEKKQFKGKVIVLVDSRSSSAAEIFARVMQLEKRGVVIGDRSGGRVMAAIHADFAFQNAQDLPGYFYGASISI